MNSTDFTKACLVALLMAVVVQTIEGQCSVMKCMVQMMSCSRSAYNNGISVEDTECCQNYFDCMRDCGAPSAS